MRDPVLVDRGTEAWSTTIGPVTRRCAVTDERVAGVVVEPGQDLDVGAVGEAVVGEVGLPALVG